jgi:hypothetical protein
VSTPETVDGGHCRPDGPLDALLNTMVQVTATTASRMHVTVITGRELRRW